MEEYDVAGRMIKSTDARGTVTEYDHDSFHGVVTQTVADAASGGLQITSDSTVDEFGRVIESLGPEHDVDGTNVRTAQWTVYIDSHETWTAQGYQTVVGSVDTLVNPGFDLTSG